MFAIKLAERKTWLESNQLPFNHACCCFLAWLDLLSLVFGYEAVGRAGSTNHVKADPARISKSSDSTCEGIRFHPISSAVENHHKIVTDLGGQDIAQRPTGTGTKTRLYFSHT